MSTSRLLVLVSSFILSGLALAEVNVNAPDYPHAKIIADTELARDDYRIITGMPKRINNAIRIESVENVEGEGKRRLIALPENADIAEVYRFYLRFFQQEGTVVYTCEERSCGNSSFWANEEFNDRSLYGRDSDQYYLAARIDSGRYRQWVQMYFILNGRKDRYILMRQISSEGDLTLSDWQRGFVIENAEISEKALESLRRSLVANPQARLWVVSAATFRADQSLAKSRAATKLAAQDFAQSLTAALPALKDRIEIEARGNLAAQPLGARAESWFVLYLRD